MNIAAAVLAAVFTYWVEVRHPESSQWVHIHSLDWETTECYVDAWTYANRVRSDYPGSQVRIVESGKGFPDRYIYRK